MAQQALQHGHQNTNTGSLVPGTSTRHVLVFGLLRWFLGLFGTSTSTT